jgi:hypothetical protein
MLLLIFGLLFIMMLNSCDFGCSVGDPCVQQVQQFEHRPVQVVGVLCVDWEQPLYSLLLAQCCAERGMERYLLKATYLV